MSDNSFSSTVASLFQGMDSFITTKTVVGDAVHIGDTIILPLIDVTFGVGAGAFSGENQDGITKILDMIPDFVNKFTSKDKNTPADPEAQKKAADELESQLGDALNEKISE